MWSDFGVVAFNVLLIYPMASKCLRYTLYEMVEIRLLLTEIIINIQAWDSCFFGNPKGAVSRVKDAQCTVLPPVPLPLLFEPNAKGWPAGTYP